MKNILYIVLLINTMITAQVSSIDCSFDNSKILQEQFDMGVYELPKGNFCIRKPLVIDQSNFELRGKFRNHSIIYSDKPIDLIRITNRVKKLVIENLTLSHKGDISENECAALRFGGFEGQNTVIGSMYGRFDFDYEGDPEGFKSRESWKLTKSKNFKSYWNDEFNFSKEKAFDNLENYTNSYTGFGAHVVWIDFANTTTSTAHMLFNSFEGTWRNFNTGFKITNTKKQNHDFKHFDIDVWVDSFKTIAFIESINMSDIKMVGQARNSLDWNFLGKSKEEKLIPFYYINGVANNIDIFGSDRKGGSGKHLYGGLIRGSRNTFNGVLSRRAIVTNGVPNIMAKNRGSSLVHPNVVDTWNDQGISGIKKYIDGAIFPRRSKLELEGNAKLILNGQRIRPFKLPKKEISFKQLVEYLIKTGILRL